MNFKSSIMVLSAAAFIAGCAAPSVPVDMDRMIPNGDTNSSVTIFSSQDIYFPGVGFSVFTDYDYYIDCLKKECLVGKMRMMQYITLHPSAGAHKLFVIPSDEGYSNKLILTEKEAVSIDFNVQPGQKTFIYHEWLLSHKSLLGPFSISDSKISVISQDQAVPKLQLISDAAHGEDKQGGFGGKGIVYQK